MIKPILFNTQMVQAILEGRKTTTRRIIKVNNSFDFIGCSSEDGCGFNRAAFGKGSFDKLLDAEIKERIKAPYMPNDILYVRETWIIQSMKNYEKNIKFLYKARPTKLNEVHVSNKRYEEMLKFECKNGWQPSLFMPKEAARIFLRVKNVKIERLQDITEHGIRAEGITEEFPPHARDKFQELWDSTTKEYKWRLNPWVWVIEFERIDKSEVEQ